MIPGQSNKSYSSINDKVYSLSTTANLVFGSLSGQTFSALVENDKGLISSLDDVSNIDSEFSDLGRASYRDHIITGKKTYKVKASVTCDVKKLRNSLVSGDITADFITGYNESVVSIEDRIFILPYEVQLMTKEFKDKTVPLNPAFKFSFINPI